MAASPAWELQAAFMALLAASADLQALIGNNPVRIYEDVPPDDAILPYVTLGECQATPDLAECIDGSILYSDLHAWSGTSSFEECKTILATMWAVLSAADIVMPNNRCVDLARDNEHSFRDADGQTKHGVLTTRATTEPL